jgi:hypothetical protein
VPTAASPSPLSRALALAATQHGLITAAQCRSLDLSRGAVHRLIARGAWSPDGPGVYRIVGGPRTWLGRAMAAVLAAEPDALLSHRSAAHVWGLEGFAAPGRIEVTVPRHSRPRARPGVTIHESNAFHLADPMRRLGVPVTGPARTIIDLAAVVDGPTVLRAVDEVRRLGRASWPELWEALVLHTVRGRPGIGTARAMLDKRYGRTVPHAEFARLFLALLERSGLPEPVSEHPVTLQGRRCRLDAAYPTERIDIELDGGRHRSEEAFENDRVRDNRIRLAGWTVLRYTWDRFTSRPDEIVDEVRLALAQARAEPASERCGIRNERTPEREGG